MQPAHPAGCPSCLYPTALWARFSRVHSVARGPRSSASRSANIPWRATRPLRITHTAPSSGIMARRCETQMTVRSTASSRTASATSISEAGSRAAVASSSSTSGAGLRKTRRRASRWRSPEDRAWPSSPTRVSRPSGRLSRSSARSTRRRGRRDPGRLRRQAREPTGRLRDRLRAHRPPRRPGAARQLDESQPLLPVL